MHSPCDALWKELVCWENFFQIKVSHQTFDLEQSLHLSATALEDDERDQRSLANEGKELKVRVGNSKSDDKPI